MHIFLCIDDTDNLESRGTGELASIIAETIENRDWGKCKRITRHQLFLHPDVPYTSHNSSMCFEAELKEEYFDDLISFASDFLSNESAKESDPGLCIVSADKITDSEKLISFGKRAKTELVTKKEAYDLAKELGIHLSEHGGTGDGVIGALAGIGLRMSGEDGRYKGKIKLNCAEKEVEAGYILSNTFIEAVRNIEGTKLKDNEKILIDDRLKAVQFDGKPTLLVQLSADENTGEMHYKPCTKQQLKQF